MTPLPIPIISTTNHKPYRILLPLDREDRLSTDIFRFAGALADAHQGEVLILHVVTEEGPESSDLEAEAFLDANASFWGLSEEDEALLAEFPHRFITCESQTVADGILQSAREESCALILLRWHGEPRAIRNKLGHVLDPVIFDAPCDVVLLKGECTREVLNAPRILLATSGGPHTIGAARLAFALAAFSGGQVTLLTIVPKGADDSRVAEAEQMLAEVISDAEGDKEVVVPRVIQAEQVPAALMAAAKKHDMVFLGATNDSVMNQILIGSMMERLSQALSQPVVIVRRYGGLRSQWLRRVWRQVDQNLPTLSLAARLDAYKRIRRGARATSDFYTLMLLSVVIATMGLLLNSGAVIIGAMLVAPLMTPILGLAMGIVLGDSRLLKISGQSVFKGVFLAIGVSAFIALVAPLVLFTPEIQARTQPNLFDLTVALAAGAAGTYSISRPKLAGALPGVAIAVALVPPLSVIGICLATARWEAAMGATLLFSTNLIAINFAAVLMNLLFGFLPPKEKPGRAPKQQGRREILRAGFFIILLLLFGISLPLARSLQQEVNHNAIAHTLGNTLEQVLQESELSLLDFSWEEQADDSLSLRVVVLAGNDVTNETVLALDEAVTNAVGRQVKLRFVIIPARVLRDD
ncbi:MAG: TIGR00341 family protein [Ardenticatenaceae bacterium]